MPAVAKTPAKRKAQRGPGQKLNLVDRYRLLELHKKNPDWSYSQLAETAGCSVDTARATCISASRSAADLMAAYTGPMLILWRNAARIASSRGDYRPARDWLLHAGAIEPIPESQRNAGPSIVIVNTSLPGLPGAQSITIDTLTIDAPKAPSVTEGNALPDKA